MITLLANVLPATQDIPCQMELAFNQPAQLDNTNNMVNVFKTQQDVILTVILPNVLNVQQDTLLLLVFVTELL